MDRGDRPSIQIFNDEDKELRSDQKGQEEDRFIPSRGNNRQSAHAVNREKCKKKHFIKNQK